MSSSETLFKEILIGNLEDCLLGTSETLLASWSMGLTTKGSYSPFLKYLKVSPGKVLIVVWPILKKWTVFNEDVHKKGWPYLIYYCAVMRYRQELIACLPSEFPSSCSFYLIHWFFIVCWIFYRWLIFYTEFLLVKSVVLIFWMLSLTKVNHSAYNMSICCYLT